MTEARSAAETWPTFPWSFNATTFRAFRKSRLPSTTSFAKPWRGWLVAKLELFGTARCPHTQEMREWLEWKRSDFVEYDVESNPAARQRMREIASGQRAVPVLVEDGKVIQIGWQGRSCFLDVD